MIIAASMSSVCVSRLYRSAKHSCSVFIEQEMCLVPQSKNLTEVLKRKILFALEVTFLLRSCSGVLNHITFFLSRTSLYICHGIVDIELVSVRTYTLENSSYTGGKLFVVTS